MEIIGPNPGIKCSICGQTSDDLLLLIPETGAVLTAKAIAVHLHCINLEYLENESVTYLFMGYVTPQKYRTIEPSKLQEDNDGR